MCCVCTRLKRDRHDCSRNFNCAQKPRQQESETYNLKNVPIPIKCSPWPFKNTLPVTSAPLALLLALPAFFLMPSPAQAGWYTVTGFNPADDSTGVPSTPTLLSPSDAR